MKTWKKRLPALLLALVLCLSLLPTAALAAEAESGDIIIRISGDVFIIRADGSVVFPEGITTLYGGTFVYNREDVRSVVIPDSITHFAGGPFLDCINLSSVTLGRGLTKIEGDAFMRCTSLKSITIPDGVTSIEMDAFKDSGLETVHLPASVTSIGTGALRTDMLSEVYYAGTMAQWSVVERNCDSVLNNRTKTSPPIHCSDGVVPAGPIVTTDPSTWWKVGPNNPYPIGGGTDTGGSTNPGGSTDTGVSSEKILNTTGFYREVREGYDVEKQGLTGNVHLAKPYNDTRYTITQYPTNFDVTPGESEYGPILTVKPKPGLPVGNYSETIVVDHGSTGYVENISLLFNVTPSSGGAVTTPDTGNSTDPTTPTTPTTPTDPTTPTTPTDPVTTIFSDVPAGEFFAAPVSWALEKDITNGTSATQFSPYEQCTQTQILTFLYRAARGGGTAAAEDMTHAVNWARDKGVIDGSLNGNAPCTRATAVTYIWKAFGQPSMGSNSFTDVPADSASAVSWAVAKGVTNGTSTTTFSPDKVCDRGEIVTFLYRAYH